MFFGQRQRKWQREKRCFQNPAAKHWPHGNHTAGHQLLWHLQPRLHLENDPKMPLYREANTFPPNFHVRPKIFKN